MKILGRIIIGVIAGLVGYYIDKTYHNGLYTFMVGFIFGAIAYS